MSRHCERRVIPVIYFFIYLVSVVLYCTSVPFTSRVNTREEEGIRKRFRKQCSETSRSRWPRGLRRGFAIARLLRLRVRITLTAWMSVCRVCVCVCCQSSVRRTDHSSGGVLPSVVFLNVTVKLRYWEGPGLRVGCSDMGGRGDNLQPRCSWRVKECTFVGVEVSTRMKPDMTFAFRRVAY